MTDTPRTPPGIRLARLIYNADGVFQGLRLEVPPPMVAPPPSSPRAGIGEGQETQRFRGR